MDEYGEGQGWDWKDDEPESRSDAEWEEWHRDMHDFLDGVPDAGVRYQPDQGEDQTIDQFDEAWEGGHR